MRAGDGPGGLAPTEALATDGDGAFLRLEGVRKSFADLVVLDGVDLAIRRGEVVCVLGPSGSGKSTLLRCVNRLVEPTGGQVCSIFRIMSYSSSVTEKRFSSASRLDSDPFDFRPKTWDSCSTPSFLAWTLFFRAGSIWATRASGEVDGA